MSDKPYKSRMIRHAKERSIKCLNIYIAKYTKTNTNPAWGQNQIKLRSRGRQISSNAKCPEVDKSPPNTKCPEVDKSPQKANVLRLNKLPQNLYLYIHTWSHSYIYVRTFIHMYSYMHTYIHMHSLMHTFIHSYRHTYSHPYIHMHTYILIKYRYRGWNQAMVI